MLKNKVHTCLMCQGGISETSGRYFSSKTENEALCSQCVSEVKSSLTNQAVNSAGPTWLWPVLDLRVWTFVVRR